MENDLIGTTALLPNGDKVKIQSIQGEIALVQRLSGWRKGTLALCSLTRLTFVNEKGA
jgi:hypothetical protein